MRSKLWVLALVTVSTALTAQVEKSDIGEWTYYRGDPAGSNSSPLVDITPENVERLRIAWEWQHGEKQLEEYKTIPGPFETQPLMIDGKLYVTTPYNNAAALDPETGRELWRYDTGAYELGTIPGSGFKHRGAALWRDTENGNELRILVNTRNKLFSLDARTGQPVKSFGDEGSVSLTDGYSRPISSDRHVSVGSPPIVYKDIVIVGHAVPDRYQRPDEVPGIVQAFDARTGERLWVFNLVPHSANDYGADTWEDESWRTTGHANVWAPMTLDEERGLVYLPTSTPGSDYYGAQRPGANLFAESIVTLDATTGERQWHFQAVHHGLWDYDFPAPANLMTITVDGQRIDAVAAVSKQGFTYVFDRANGEPVWPIEERPVNTESDVPGEQVYPTQPFPSKPPPFTPQGISLEDANDMTPEIKALAQAEMKKYRLGPMFTPPSLRGTLMRPAQAGGANWGGAAYDAETGYLIVRATNRVYVNALAANDGSDPRIVAPYSDWLVSRGEQFSSMRGMPIVKPPYANLTAIDMNKGEIAWQIPLGEGSATIRNHPLLQGVELPSRLGSATTGGALVTASGLVFIGGGDGYLYAFDKYTGHEIWRGSIPFPNAAVPMSYRAPSGRQFIVVSGGGGSDGTLVAFALDAVMETQTSGENSAPEREALSGIAAGRAAFERACRVCHGAEGRGDAAPALVPFALDVNQVTGIVRDGRSEMPPLSERTVSTQEILEITDYLRSLSP